MLDFALTDAYEPFTIAFMLMCGIGLIEAIGLGIGSIDLDGHGHAFDVGDHSPLHWLGFGEDMPVLIWLTSLLACFSVSGFGIQQIAEGVTGGTLDATLAAGFATPSALFLNFFAANGLHRIIPKTETTAIGQDEIVGLRGSVVEAPASQGRASRAKVVDRHGQMHLVPVMPHEDVTIQPGETVLIVRREGAVYYAVTDGVPELRSIA